MNITPRHATVVLNKNPQLPPEIIEYYRDIANGQLKTFYIQRLIMLRDEYSNEVPSFEAKGINVVPDASGKVYRRYKVQVHFRLALRLSLEDILSQKLITDRLIEQEIKQFLANDNIDFSVGDEDIPNKIAAMNQILSVVIEYLRSS